MNKNYDNHTPGYGGGHSMPKEGSAMSSDDYIEPGLTTPPQEGTNPSEGHGYKSQEMADDCEKSWTHKEFATANSLANKISPTG